MSIIFFVIGPAVSRVDDIGIIPDLLTLPMGGFIPTKELAEEGDKIDPDLSDPEETDVKFDAVAAPLPQLHPPVSLFFLP